MSKLIEDLWYHTGPIGPMGPDDKLEQVEHWWKSRSTGDLHAICEWLKDPRIPEHFPDCPPNEIFNTGDEVAERLAALVEDDNRTELFPLIAQLADDPRSRHYGVHALSRINTQASANVLAQYVNETTMEIAEAIAYGLIQLAEVAETSPSLREMQNRWPLESKIHNMIANHFAGRT